MNPENFDDGYFLVSRSIIKSEVFHKEKWLKFFVWCLSKARFQDGTVEVKTGKSTTIVKLKRGQFIFGRKSAAKKLKFSLSTCRNLLEIFRKRHILDTQKDTHWTVVTILNFDDYQKSENYKGHPKGHPKDRQGTGKGQARDTNNNVKNDKNVKNVITYPKEFLKLWTDYPNIKGSKTQTLKNYQTTKKNLSPDQIYSACMNSIKKQDDEKNEMYFQLSNLIGEKYRGDLNDLLNYKSPEDEAIRLINEKRQKKADLLNAKLGPAFGGPHGKANQ